MGQLLALRSSRHAELTARARGRDRLDSTSTALFSVTNDQRPSAVATTAKGLPGTGTAAWGTALRTGAAA